MKTAHDVKLLNGSKQEVSYTGVETVTMPGTDGQDKIFTAGTPIDALDIQPDFSGGDMPLESPEGYVVRSATIKKPEGAEQVIANGETLAGITGEYVTPGTVKEITPDFSGGDQIVTAGGDERWSSVTVKKPEGLVPDNIASGVEIAGVVGSLSAITVKAIAERSVSGNLYDESVQFVGAYAFANCIVLEEVSFPMCSSVGSHAFARCSGLIEASIPGTVSVSTYTFSGCTGLSTVTIGCNSNFYTSITDGAFNMCSSLSEIKFMFSGSYVDGYFTGITSYAFSGCHSLERIRIYGKSVTGANNFDIGAYAFNRCSALSSCIISGYVGCFDLNANSNRTEWDIGGYAFSGCSSLKSLSLVISGQAGFGVSEYAFCDCVNLTDLWLEFLPSAQSSSGYYALGSSAFYNTTIASSGLTGKFGSIHVTSNVYPYLRIASGWKAYSARMVSY